jgi:hypothetical protein
VAVICDDTIVHRFQFVQRWLAAPPGVVVLYGHATAPRQPGRARLGGAEGVAANSPTLAIEGRIR